MENKRILVIGGYGYIGKEIVSILLEHNYNITLISRMKRNNKDLVGDVLDKEFLLKNVKDFDCIIYLAAIVRSINKFKYRENIISLRNLIDVMKINNVKRIIYFSTQNVYLEKTGYYGNSKKECDKTLINSGVEYIIIRPNYVYGIDKENYFYQLIRLIRKFKICLIIGNGDNKFQPINKKDVANITLKCLNNFKTSDIIDVSGKCNVSVNEVIEFIKKETNSKFLVIHIPLFILKIFKNIIPFDVDGFDKDRVSLNADFNNVKSEFYSDLKNIINLQ